MRKPDASQDRCYNVMHRRFVFKFCKITWGRGSGDAGVFGVGICMFSPSPATILGN